MITGIGVAELMVIVILLGVVAVPLILIVKSMGSSGRRRDAAETERLARLDQMSSRLEQRLDNLETILEERRKK